MAEIRVRSARPVGDLRPGDSVELSVSAQVKIDRDENWIGMKVHSFVGPDETGTQAHERAQAYLMEKFTKTVESTVQRIQEMGS